VPTLFSEIPNVTKDPPKRKHPQTKKQVSFVFLLDLQKKFTPCQKKVKKATPQFLPQSFLGTPISTVDYLTD